jgi:hypothetical protein
MPDLNWVRERHACSTMAMFEKLKMEVEQDVKQRNELCPEKAHYGFKFVSSSSAFAAVREGNNIHASIAFSVEKGVIVVKDDNKQIILRASLTLNDEGECRFQVNGQERESWQLRKVVLESIFFGDFE